jgi:hypothetical protein
MNKLERLQATVLFFIVLFFSVGVHSQENAVADSVQVAKAVAADSVLQDFSQPRFIPADSAMVDSLVPAELRQPVKLGPFSELFGRQNKFLSYLDGLVGGNVDRSFEKKIDLNFIVMPSYTREGSFGLGGGVTGLYRLDKTDSIMQPSDITIIANATINGVLSLQTYGNTHFPGRRLRFSHKLEYAYSPLNFWGISYDACSTNPMINYTRNQVDLNTDLVYLLRGPFNVGAALDFVYSYITKMDNWNYLEGQNREFLFTGVGVSLQYDTRDFIPNPRKGMNLVLRGSIRPNFLSSYGKTLYNASLIFNYYVPMWKGSMLAFDFYGCYNSPDSPWPLKQKLGAGGIRMRGYYGGRYIDNNMLSAQVEYRQHIYSRLGCAFWVGGASVFPTFSSFDIKDVLPNYGIGLRIELKHNVNGRIDYGFGKGTGGFVFSIGEAF